VNRIEALVSQFTRQYGHPPRVVARAPGRVNLLGEHTDYNGLPVLPMAIDRSILVAGTLRDDRQIRLANVDSQFPPRRYAIERTMPAFSPGDWGNYHKAATHGLLSWLGPTALHGGDFLIDGDIPRSAGLSSSSAFVVGSALALLAVNERTWDPTQLADLLASAERYVGTLSGGMDQAVCLLAQPGRALRIDFDPLRTRPVPVPSGCVFVVCNSLVAAEKSGAARAAYNRRVMECRLACHALEQALGSALPRSLAHFGDLARLFPDRPLTHFLALLENTLPPRPLAISEIAELLGMSADSAAAGLGLSQADESPFWLLQRARHVLSEAERVNRGEVALASGDWVAFGALMDASHASCRDDYDVSCAELEALVAVAKEAGAIGARVTGAGFGGCTVNLVATRDVPFFLTMVDRGYYQPRLKGSGREHCFVFTPGAGAEVVRI
jgi:N-acetylgalactosamine kinase